MVRLSLILLFAAACAGDRVQTVSTPGGDIAADPDTTPPTIEHVPITDSQPYMEDVEVTATVTDDDSGVFVVQVVYKRVDSTVWDQASMLADEADPSLFLGVIPSEDVLSSGLDYYLFAVDKEGNESYSPEDGESDAYHFRVNGD